MSKIFTLDEILGKEQRIISDSAIYSSGGWYGRFIYGASRFSELNENKLRGVNELLSEEIFWWSRPNVFTTEKAITEIEHFNRILRNNFRYLKRKERKSNGKRTRNEFMETCALYDIIFQKAFQSQYCPEDLDVFNLLENLVIKVGEETSAKRDYSKRHGKKKRNGKPDLHTDEQLVAAAIYSSVIENVPCSIVTPDSDSPPRVRYGL